MLLFLIGAIIQVAKAPISCSSRYCGVVHCPIECPAGSTAICNPALCTDCLTFGTGSLSQVQLDLDLAVSSYQAGVVVPDLFSSAPPSTCGAITCQIGEWTGSICKIPPSSPLKSSLSGNNINSKLLIRQNTEHEEAICVKCQNQFNQKSDSFQVRVQVDCSDQLLSITQPDTVFKLTYQLDNSLYEGPENNNAIMSFPSTADSTGAVFINNLYPSGCQFPSGYPQCSLMEAGCLNNFSGSEITMINNVIKVKMILFNPISICVKCLTSHNTVQTPNFQLSVVCGPSQTIFQNNQPVSVTQILKKFGGPNIFHEFKKDHFNHGAPTMCPETYSIDTSQYPSNPGSLSMTEITSGTFHVNPVPIKVGVYNFDARAQVNGQSDYFSKPYKLTIACGTGSVSLGEPTTGFNLIQYVQKSTSQTYFAMPEFTTSNSECPISKYEAIEISSTNVISSLTVSQSGSNIHIQPTNTASILEYKFRIRATMQGHAVFGDEELISTGQYTLRVGCGIWQTITEDTSFVKTQTIVAEDTGASSQYTIVPPVMFPSFCQPIYYTIQNVSPTPSAIQFMGSATNPCTYSTGSCDKLQIDTMTERVITFDILIEGDNKQLTSSLVTITVSCSTNSIITPSIISSQKQFVSSTVQAQFTFPLFTSTLNTACPLQNIELSSISGSVSAPTDLEYNFDPLLATQTISPTSSVLKKTYKFYLKISAQGATSIFTPEYTLNVVCNKDSTTISISSSTVLEQFVDTAIDTLGNGGTGTFDPINVLFKMPLFISSNTQCPLLSSGYLISSTKDTYTAMSDPKLTVGSELMIEPSDKLLANKYIFYILGEAEVDSAETIKNILYSEQLILYVGCNSQWISFDSPTNFVTSFPLFVRDQQPTNEYTFDAFSSFPTYCPIISIQLANVSPAGSMIAATTLENGCDTSNSCRKVYVDTSLKRQITFQLLITSVASGSLYSQTVTSNVICGPDSVTISEVVPTLTRDQVQKLTTVVANVKFVFQKYLTDHVDCPIQQMMISNTYGSVTPQTDLIFSFDSTQVDQIVNAVNPDLKALHIFYIKAIAEGGKELWQQSGTKNTLKIECGPISTAITAPTVTETLKYVDVNQTNDAFISFPRFTHTQEIECPTLDIQVVMVNQDLARTDMIITPPNQNVIVVKPSNDSIDRQYLFRVKAFAEGGAESFTVPITLNIGCGHWNIITPPPIFITTGALYVNEPNPLLYSYNFDNFTIFPEYCTLDGYVEADVTPPGRVIYPGEACKFKQSHCTSVEIDTEFEGIVSFRMKILNEGDMIYYSEFVAYTITCGPNSVNFTKPQPIYEFIGNIQNQTLSQNKKENSETETKFLFAPLDSPAAGCPIVKTEISKMDKLVIVYDEGTFQYFNGYYEFQPSIIKSVTQYNFYIRLEAKGGSFGWTDRLTLNVGCGFWIKIIPTSGNFTKLMNVLVDEEVRYPIAEFQTDTPHCPIENFIITNNFPSNTIKYPSQTCSSDTDITCYLADVDTSAEQQITFRITIIAGNGRVLIDSDPVIINIECGNNIQIKTVDPSAGYVQEVKSSNAQFIFETFQPSNPSCPIVSMEISYLFGISMIPRDLNFKFDENSSVQVVKPKFSDFTKKYQFFVKAQAKGGSIAWSSKLQPYVLDVEGKKKVEKKEKIEVNKTVEIIEEEIIIFEDKTIYDGNFTCRIKKVDTEGVAHLIFSENMIDENRGFNISWINETTLNLTVIPTEGSLFEMQKYKDPNTGEVSLDFLNFTWEPLSFKGDTLLIQLSFKYPLNVSTSSQERDILQVQILNRTFFKTDEGIKILAPKSQELNRFISRLVLDGSISLEALFSNEGEEGNPLISFLINLILCSTLVNLLGMINSLQIICFQIMLNIINPGNVQLFLQGILQIINADFFDPEWTTKLVFNFDSDENVVEEIIDQQKETILINQIQEIGFETFSPILNMGGLFVITILYFSQILLMFAMMLFLKVIIQIMRLNQIVHSWKTLNRVQNFNPDEDSEIKGTQFEGGNQIIIASEQSIPKYRRRNCAPKLKVVNPEKYELQKLKRELAQFDSQRKQLQYIRKFYKIDKVKSNKCCLCFMKCMISKINRTKKSLFFNDGILIVLESVCQFAISSYLYWMRPNEEFDENQLTYFGQLVTSYFCLTCLIVVTLMSIVLIFINEEYLMLKSVKRRIFMLYEHQKLSTTSGKAYTLLFILRRLNIVAVSFIWQEQSSLQVIAMVIQNMLFMIYIGNWLPLRSYKMNRIELVNEICIDFITLHLVLFTNFCHNQYTKNNAGFSMIALVIINIIYNLYFPTCDFIRGIKLRLKKLLKRIPYWYKNFWPLLIDSEYIWVAENATQLQAAWMAYQAQKPKQNLQLLNSTRVTTRDKIDFIKQHRKELSFADMDAFVDQKTMNEEPLQLLQQIYQNMKDNEDNITKLRVKTFYLRRRIYMNSIRILFPRFDLKTVHDQSKQLKQLFPSERSRIFYEKNSYDYLIQQFKGRFMEEKFEKHQSESAKNKYYLQFQIENFEDFYEINKELAQTEYIEQMRNYLKPPFENLMRKFEEKNVNLYKKEVHNNLCKELTSKFIEQNLIPKLNDQIIEMWPHHLFQIIYPREQIQQFEGKMFRLEQKLYDSISGQIRQDATVDELEDIFSQIVKNNDTKFDSIKWSLKQINELGSLSRKERTRRLDMLFEDYRYGNSQMARYIKVNDNISQLYYFLVEYHNAEILFLEGQEKNIMNSMTIPPSIIQDKDSEAADHQFCQDLITLIRETEIREFQWSAKFIK